ncbi:MAG TPA: hypothetical protein VGH29_10850, partial [Candidatus Binataceae bacterium]
PFLLRPHRSAVDSMTGLFQFEPIYLHPPKRRRRIRMVAMTAPAATASGGALKNAIITIAALAAAPNVSAVVRWRVIS